MISKAATVEEYLASLPVDRGEALTALRQAIRRALPRGYEEGMQYGMIAYFVPHRLYPAGYHCDPKQPLPFLGLASQKQYISLYLPIVWGRTESETPESKRFRQAWLKTGKKLDMGKCCIRFKRLEDVAVDVVTDTIRRTPVATHIRRYEETLAGTSIRRRKPPRAAARKKAAAAR